MKYPKLVLTGDFNIAPSDNDVYDPSLWKDKVLCSKDERVLFSKLLESGFIDVHSILESKIKIIARNHTHDHSKQLVTKIFAHNLKLLF